MNDQERILQEELERVANEARLRPGMFEAVMRRAQRRRNLAVTSGAAALVVFAIAAALVIPDGRGDREDLASPEIQPGVVRLLTEPRGLLEIEAAKGELCYAFNMRGVTSTRVVDRATGELVFNVRASDYDGGRMLGCHRGIDRRSLDSVANDPDAYLVRFENSASGGTSDAELRRDEGDPTCYPIPPSSPEYSLHFSKLEGEPGEVVHVWAPTLRDEGGRYSPSDGLELWWNSRTPDGLQPIADGAAVKLFTADTSDRCYFQAAFEVPEVPAGRYRTTGFVFQQPRRERYGVWPGPRFRVRPSDREAQPKLEVETETIDIDDQPTALATGEGSVWVTTGMRRELLEIRDGEIINRFAGGGRGMAVSDGIVWQTRGGDGAEPDGEVTGIDATTGEVVQHLEFPRETPYGVAARGGELFIAFAQGDLVRPDPANNAEMRIALGTGLTDVLIAHGAVWVSQPGGQNPRVWRVTVSDDGSNAAPFLLTPQGKGSCPQGLAATADALWVADPCAAALWKLDPSGNTVGRIDNVGKKPADVAAGPHFLFVSSFRGDEIVTIIDRSTEKVVDQVEVGEGPSSIVADGQGAWVANSEGTSLTHILPLPRSR